MAIKLTWSTLSLPHQRIDPELGATGIRELSKGEYPDHPDAKTKILGQRFDWFVKETGIRHRDFRESRLKRVGECERDFVRGRGYYYHRTSWFMTTELAKKF